LDVKTWSRTLRGNIECLRQGAEENIRTAEDEVIGAEEKFRNEELHNLHHSPRKSKEEVRKDEIGIACSTHGKIENAYRI
jgi:hypothetical protein